MGRMEFQSRENNCLDHSQCIRVFYIILLTSSIKAHHLQTLAGLLCLLQQHPRQCLAPYDLPY